MRSAANSCILKAAAGVFFAVGLAGNVAAAERELRFVTPTATGVHSSPMTASIELGYFAEEGIKVVHRSFPTTLPIMQGVAAKEIDVGVGGVFPLVVANQPGKTPMPLVVFYNQIRQFAFEIVVPPNSPLTRIADLKGKKLGVLALTSPYAPVTRTVLKDAGLGPNDVELVVTGENQKAFELLEKGEVDAYETFVGNSALYEANGNKLRRLPYDPKITTLPTTGYFAHEDTMKKDPQLLARFTRAMTKGVLTCNIAPEWCVKTLWKHFPHLQPSPEVLEKELARQVYVLKGGMKGYLSFPPGTPRRFGEYPKDAFPNLIAILKVGGEVPANANATSFYTNDLVDQINEFDVAAVEARAAKLK